jgi:peptidoglycan/LPS O-acetylase OafA/YrhL
MPAISSAAAGQMKRGRFPVLDALRIVLALCVTFDHVGIFPLFAGVDPSTPLGHFLVRGWITVTWGVPAVIGFFVISGFCIHLPFRGDEKLSVGRYYARRYARILIPVAAAIFVCRAIGIKQPLWSADSVLWHSVLWSLACEELYYAVYPAARLVRKRFGWTSLLAPAFLLGAFLAFRYPNALDGTFLGVLKTAVILFPIWLLGCLLAEQSDRLRAVDSRGTIWRWRFLAWFGSWVCEMLHFHAKWSQELTMLGFGVLAYFWIREELSFASQSRSFRILAWAGMWSYSLYLMHGPAATMVSALHLPNFGYIVNWLLLYAGVLGISYVFYLCVEKPSHRLARRFHLNPTRKKAAVAGLSEADSDSPKILADGLVQPQGELS